MVYVIRTIVLFMIGLWLKNKFKEELSFKSIKIVMMQVFLPAVIFYLILTNKEGISEHETVCSIQEELIMPTDIKAEYVQQEQFEELINQKKPVVVDYTATWCGPCRLVAPLIDQLAADYQGRAEVVKIDLDQNKGNAKQYSIKSIPAVLIFKNGQEVDRIVGRATYEEFSNALDKQL